MPPRHVHVHLHGATQDAGWEESKHPRSSNGQFGRGGSDPAQAQGKARREQALARYRAKEKIFRGAGRGNEIAHERELLNLAEAAGLVTEARRHRVRIEALMEQRKKDMQR